MLKNLSPIVSGALLHALDAAPSGAWIAIVSAEHDVPEGIPIGHEGVEEVAMAVLAVTPLDPDAPIVIEGDNELSDISFAVAGLAADAEGRRFETLPVSETAFGALLTASRVTVVVDTADSFGFLLCKGRC
ncbi:RbsD/FucU domain-containing protein [Humibacter sp.]|jgi:L-fucose mutarotase|uniref:RbsD/FucU domain-containing protein n=1 Tax=Humibacter sp. TaxID=1940291 RepID=UPI003F8080A7